MMRLFVAIPVPPDVQARVRDLIEAMRPLATFRWERVEDAHVTTKFIGEVAAPSVADIERALRALAPPAMQIVVRGTGWFPDSVTPRVLWAGVDAPPALGMLADETDRALAGLGVPRETRPYTPHVTLARVPAGASTTTLQRWLRSRPSPELGAFTAERFVLYESARESGTSSVTRHKVLAQIPLSAPSAPASDSSSPQ